MPGFTGERNPLSFLRKRGLGFSFGTALAALPSEDVQSCVVLASDSHQWHCPWNFNYLQASSATSPVPKHKVSQLIKVCLQAGGSVLSLCHPGCPFLLQSLCLLTISSPKICHCQDVAALWPWLWTWTMNSRLCIPILQSSQVITSWQHLAQSRTLGSISSNYFRRTGYTLGLKETKLVFFHFLKHLYIQQCFRVKLPSARLTLTPPILE